MFCFPRFLLAMFFLLPACSALNAQDKNEYSVPVKKVTFAAKEITLREALRSIAKQTGIEVKDLRSTASNPSLQAPATATTFWQALDDIAHQAKCRLSMYQRDGSVALVDGAPSVVKPHHHGPFRTTIRRIANVKDFAGGFHTCRVGLEFAWTPGFEPYFLELKKYQAVFAPINGKPTAPVIGQGKSRINIQGIRAVEEDLLMAATPRQTLALKSLTGIAEVIIPSKMEAVVFEDLKSASMAKAVTKRIGKNVRVTLKQLRVLAPDLWQIRLELNYPPNGPHFESYENWLALNEISLQHRKDKSKNIKLGSDSANILTRTPHHAVVDYVIGDDGKSPQLGNLADWRLLYRTPASFVVISVPFAFKDVPLP